MARQQKKHSRSRRSAPPPPEPPKSPVSEFFAHLSWKWIISTAAGLSALLGVVIAWEKAHPIIEPWWYADRGYVREYNDTTTAKRIEPIAKRFEDYEAFRIEQTMEMAKLNLNTLEQNLLLAKTEVEKYPDSQTAKDAVSRLTRLVGDTKKRIEGYESALFARRQLLNK